MPVRIPSSILACFKDASFQIDFEGELRDWLSTNKIEELDCSWLKIRPELILSIAKVIAKSDVHTMDFSDNELGEAGPATAAALTGEHSKVQSVNFSGNNLREAGPATAAALTGEYSKVQSVNFSGNNLREAGPATAAAL